MACYQTKSLPSNFTATGRQTYATEADCLDACAEGACCEADGSCNIKPQCECDTENGAVFAGVGETCPCCGAGCDKCQYQQETAWDVAYSGEWKKSFRMFGGTLDTDTTTPTDAGGNTLLWGFSTSRTLAYFYSNLDRPGASGLLARSNYLSLEIEFYCTNPSSNPDFWWMKFFSNEQENATITHTPLDPNESETVWTYPEIGGGFNLFLDKTQPSKYFTGTYRLDYNGNSVSILLRDELPLIRYFPTVNPLP